MHPPRPAVNMDYEVLPLSITHPEWSVLINACQDLMGQSPTRGLDATHLKINDPASFLACLNMENEPLKSLRVEGSWFEHFMASFLMIVDEEAIIVLTKTPIRLLHKEARKHKYIVIATGNMSEWKRAILSGCSESAEFALRWIMNQVLARFEQVGFREIFSNYKKIPLHDKTFTLKWT